MKKTLNISIAHRLFNLEDDAYQKLDQYLSSIKSHFNDSPDKAEIIADIEERIAEHFLESKTGIITLSDVESLVKTMGTVDQFEQPEGKEGSKKSAGKSKQLFRDTDDAVVAGVASGISHYFAIDPLILRIIFAASIFAGGTGFLIYVILWLVIPEAKTASQKLLMHGDPITLETLSETARERLSEIKSRDQRGFRKLITLPFRIIGNVVRFLAYLLPNILRFFFGSILSVVSVVVLVTAMIATGFMVSSDVMVFDNVTLETFIPGFLRHIIILGAALTVMIPALFALMGGISLFKKKSVITSYVGFGLLGAWLIALSVTGYGAAKVGSRYETLVNTSPVYQETSETKAIEETFQALDVENGLNVEIVEGTTSSMTTRGRAGDIATIKAVVTDGKLTIEREPVESGQFCLFCFTHHGSVEITLTVPNSLESVSVKHGSFVTGDLGNSSILELTIENGSDAEFQVQAKSIIAHILHGSHLTLTGKATSTDITLENGSAFNAEELENVDAKITALQGSRADIRVSKALNATTKNGSAIYYSGDPVVTKTEASGSSVLSVD